jgi:hypothetical protein
MNISPGEGWYGTCPRCGQFGITFEAIENLHDNDRPLLSGWVRDQNHQGEEQPTIDLEKLNRVLSLPEISMSERPIRFLRE